jgi:hypothetical protein
VGVAGGVWATALGTMEAHRMESDTIRLVAQWQGFGVLLPMDLSC